MHRAPGLVGTVFTCAALALPGMLSAKNTCPVIQAMLVDNAARLKGIGITVNDKGLVDVTFNGSTDVLRDATRCDLASPSDGFEVDCTWDFDSEDREQAQRAFDTLRNRLDGCLPARLEKQKPFEYTAKRLEELRTQYGDSFVESVQSIGTLSEYGQTIALDPDNDLSVQIYLKESTTSGTVWIDASLSRD